MDFERRCRARPGGPAAQESLRDRPSILTQEKVWCSTNRRVTARGSVPGSAVGDSLTVIDTKIDSIYIIARKQRIVICQETMDRIASYLYYSIIASYCQGAMEIVFILNVYQLELEIKCNTRL